MGIAYWRRNLNGKEGLEMYVSVGNVSVSFDIVGSGPRPLLFLHGWLMSKESWHPLLKHLPMENYRAYLVDVRGFGDTDKPPTGYAIEDYARDTLRLIRHWNIRPVTLIGHSFGGAGALFIAAKLRHYVDTLVVLDTFPGGGAPSVSVITKEHLRRVEKLVHRTPEHRLPEILNRIWLQAFYRAPDSEIMTKQKDAIKKITGHVLEQTIQTNLTTNIDPLLRHIHCPTLVIRGEHDRMLASDSEPLQQISGAHFVKIASTGHYPMLEAPDQVARAIQEFLMAH